MGTAAHSLQSGNMHIQVVLSALVAVASADPFYANYGAVRSLPYAYAAGLRSGYIAPVVRAVAPAPLALAAVAPVARVAPVAAVAPVAPVARVAPVAAVAAVAPVAAV